METIVMFAAFAGSPAPDFAPFEQPKPTQTATANPPRCKCAAGACDCIPDFGGMGRCGCFPPIATGKAPATYADVYARVSRGERVVWEGAPPGMPFGVYDCWLAGGKPVMNRRYTGVAPVVSPADCPPGQQ